MKVGDVYRDGAHCFTLLAIYPEGFVYLMESPIGAAYWATGEVAGWKLVGNRLDVLNSDDEAQPAPNE